MFRNRVYNIITIYLVFVFILLSCSDNNQLNANNSEIAKEFEIQKNALQDSSKLIALLYRDLTKFPFKAYSDFSYEVSYNVENKLITIKSSNTIEGNEIDYFILFKDTANVYVREEYSYTDYSYKYIKSYFSINGQEVDLTKINISDLENQKTEPSLLWYGKDFGISAKFYKIEEKEYFLIRGLNLYCNGNHCSSYQMFLLQKDNNRVKASTYYFSGLYPYDFENTFLFNNNEGKPKFFLPKEVDELKTIEDFELIEVFK